jgi:hypothetical protein
VRAKKTRRVKKTTVSIPTDLFGAADDVARRLGLSRSALYAMAVRAFVASHGDTDVTEQVNRVYAKIDSRLDPALRRYTLRFLRREKW